MRQAELVILIVVSALTGYGCKKQEGQVKPNKQYKIAFCSERDGDVEIYVMDADGSEQKNLTNNPAIDEEPSWSPDGTKIAFVSARDGNWEIYIMNADGSDQKDLTNDPAYDGFPRWSPDSTKLAFVSNRDGNNEIYVMNADGGEQKNLTNTATAEEGHPQWTPDGTKIGFVSRRQSRIRIPFLWEGSQRAEIYVMNSDGSRKRRLTNTGHDRSPVWSPVPLPTEEK